MGERSLWPLASCVSPAANRVCAVSLADGALSFHAVELVPALPRVQSGSGWGPAQAPPAHSSPQESIFHVVIFADCDPATQPIIGRPIAKITLAQQSLLRLMGRGVGWVWCTLAEVGLRCPLGGSCRGATEGGGDARANPPGGQRCGPPSACGISPRWRGGRAEVGEASPLLARGESGEDGGVGGWPEIFFWAGFGEKRGQVACFAGFRGRRGGWTWLRMFGGGRPPAMPESRSTLGTTNHHRHSRAACPALDAGAGPATTIHTVNIIRACLFSSATRKTPMPRT